MNKKHIRFCFIFLFIISVTNIAQIRIDSSYNINSTFTKISKKYPNASIPDNTNIIKQIKYYSNIVYWNVDSNRSLKLDIIRDNKSNSPEPVILFVHGGGWSSGNKNILKKLAERISANGFVSVLVEYRLSPEAKYPAAINDIKNAYNWLLENSKEYKLDMNNYILLGSSAGAHIAGMAALDISENESKVASYINIDGIVSFITPLAVKWENRKGESSAAAKWLGGTYEQIPKVWNEASLTQYINETSPKTLFINSSHERFSAGQKQYIAKLNTFDIISEKYILEDSPHSFWLYEPWISETVEVIIKFLNEN